MIDADPPATFDYEVVEAVAAETGTDAGTLRDALARHQAHARSLPGVDDLVYEWRTFLPYDPLVGRLDGDYYLVFTDSVWAEFGEQLSFANDTLAAVRAVHDQQFRRGLPSLDADERVLEGGAAMVLSP